MLVTVYKPVPGLVIIREGEKGASLLLSLNDARGLLRQLREILESERD
jgi:hypothetical protein